MPDVNFDCSFCKQNLDAPEDMAGMNIECPACGRIISVPPLVPGEPPAAPPKQNPPAAKGRGSKAETGPIPGNLEDKGSTTRIEVPPEFAKPRPKHRVIFIKRVG
ncbi:MAG: hypothetical protein V1873_08450 [Verrucomicrobiota bacterium]